MSLPCLACKLRLDSHPNQEARLRLIAKGEVVTAHIRREEYEASHQRGTECLGGEIQEAKRCGGSFSGGQGSTLGSRS